MARKASARRPLNRDRVLRAAVALADRAGLEALSMRRLGHDLGVEAMSLYNHVAGKEDVLDGMVDLVFAEVEVQNRGADWRTAMRARGESLRGALARHPWAIGLLESRKHAGPATLGHHDAVLGSLRQGGFSVTLAAHAYSVLDSYIYGFTLNEQALPFESPEEATEVAAGLLPAALQAAYPHLAEIIAELATTPDYNYGAEFEFGLDLILDGLAGLLRTR